MPPFRLVAGFETADDFLAAHDAEISVGGLFVRGATLPPGTPLSDCVVEVRVPGQPHVETLAKLASATPGVGVAVIFLSAPKPLLDLAVALRAASDADPQSDEVDSSPPEDPDSPPGAPARKGALRPLLTMPEKFELAMHGDRENRIAMLRDPNKQLHTLVLKNPRCSLEEAGWAAKQTTLNPDALKVIAEHPEWGMNPTVATSLVRNPKTPIPVALRVLPRVPVSELKVIARSQGRPQVVQGAKKLLMNR